MAETTPPSVGTFDYIIVGAGSAGCVLANRLSADPGTQVLLLEAGDRDSYPWIHIPVGYLYTRGNPRTDWMLKLTPEDALGGRSIDFPRGRVLGGSSSINGMVYIRGQSADYDHWRQLGCTGWAWEDVLPYFKKSEKHHGGADEAHGGDGELHVSQQRIRWPILDRWAEAAQECGIPWTDDFNRGDNEGVGDFEVTQYRGMRWSAARAFLRPAEKRPNLTVMTKSLANRVLFDGKRAGGVDFDRDGVRVSARARREVILSSGAIGSPQILQLSGVGPGLLLQKHGIPVVLDAEVGENLQDHLQTRLAFRVTNTKTLNEGFNSLFNKMGWALQFALTRRGPMTMSVTQIGCFAKSDPGRATANLQYHVQALSLDTPSTLHKFPAITASVCNLRPESRGHVRIDTSDPRMPPQIRANYLSDPADKQVAVDAIKLTRRIAKASALAPFGPEEFLPGEQFKTDEEILEGIKPISGTIFHPSGTCRMGPDTKAVVDERLRVKGIQGLRVVDASIMPTVTSGNTNAPVIMIAEKASDMILADAKAGKTIHAASST